MTRLIFPYVEQEHPVFGKVNRPLLKLAFYSEHFDRWLAVNKILVDTGADISVIPLPLGQILVNEVESGQPMQLDGVLVSNFMVNAFMHRIQTRLGNYVFEMPAAVSTSTVIPPIFGRQEALDRFMVRSLMVSSQ